MQVTLASLLGLGPALGAGPGAQKPAADISPKSGGDVPDPTAHKAIDQALITLLWPWKAPETPPPILQLNSSVPGARAKQPNAGPVKPDGDAEPKVGWTLWPSLWPSAPDLAGGREPVPTSATPSIATHPAGTNVPVPQLPPVTHAEQQTKPTVSAGTPAIESSVRHPSLSTSGAHPGLPPILLPRPSLSTGGASGLEADVVPAPAKPQNRPTSEPRPVDLPGWFGLSNKPPGSKVQRAILNIERLFDRLPPEVREQGVSLRDAALRLIKAGVPYTDVISAIKALVRASPGKNGIETVGAKFLANAAAAFAAFADQVEAGAPASSFRKIWPFAILPANPLVKRFVGQDARLWDVAATPVVSSTRPDTHSARMSSGANAIPTEPSKIVERIKQLLAEGIKRTVTLRLDPPELGSIELTVNAVGSRVEANFVASSPEARAVLEANRQALVEALQSRGLELGAMHVGDQRRSHELPRRWSNYPSWRVEPTPDVRIAPVPSRWHFGIVDYTV